MMSAATVKRSAAPLAAPAISSISLMAG